MFTLNLTFAKASGKKHSMKIAGAKEVQDPAAVKALMQHIVDQNVLYTKADPIVSAHEAKLQRLTESEISL
ncbi:MAG: DUF2922 domain-containing protein [Peptostreptococcaceae bacterium]|nr:DUF2922 domain-containing protein [Peptostreptococcaceae bacterium]